MSPGETQRDATRSTLGGARVCGCRGSLTVMHYASSAHARAVHTHARARPPPRISSAHMQCMCMCMCICMCSYLGAHKTCSHRSACHVTTCYLLRPTYHVFRIGAQATTCSSLLAPCSLLLLATCSYLLLATCYLLLTRGLRVGALQDEVHRGGLPLGDPAI